MFQRSIGRPLPHAYQQRMADALASCTFTHKGYGFQYDFESGKWSYADPNAPTPQPTQRPEGAPTDATAVPVDEKPAEAPAGE